MHPADALAGSRLYEDMLHFIKLGWRRVGTPPHKAAAEYIVQRFTECGLQDARVEPLEMICYTPERWGLTVGCDRLPAKSAEVPCFPLWHSGSVVSEVKGAELVHVGFGSPPEFQGKSVKGKVVVVDSLRMVNFFPTMDFFRTYERARLEGAAGLVAIHDTPPGTTFTTYATRHQTFQESRQASGNIPAVVLDFDAGQYLKQLLPEPGVTADMEVKASITPGPTENVFGVLPGARADDAILVGTHIDSWFDGAIDNAGANAGFLGLLEHFSQLPVQDRPKKMVFAGFAGHEVGSIGATTFAQQHAALLPQVSTFCMLDGFGSKGYLLEAAGRGACETGLDEAKGLFTTDNDVLFQPAARAVFAHRLLPALYMSAVAGPFSDLGPFVAAKVPSIMVIGKGIFYHTIADTADKVLPGQLERTALAHADILRELQHTPTAAIRKADRKGIKPPPGGPKGVRSKGKPGSVSLSFQVTPNPVPAGATGVIYLTHYSAAGRLFLGLTWSVDGKPAGTSPICPFQFTKAGMHSVTLTLHDHTGEKFAVKKKIFVV